MAADLDLEAGAVYESAARGFSTEMTAERAQQVAADPGVALVQPVQRVKIALHDNQFQTLVEGIDRIDADENPSAGIGSPPGPDLDADIAIIDTGIDLDHPDLNAMSGFGAYEEFQGFAGNGEPIYGDCNTGHDTDDVHGHGTHVAGTAAAIDDDHGVVGVAPGARVWAVRVLRDDGFGCDADVLLGIEWVTERKMEYLDGAGDGDPGINFTVANMSLGGPPDPALCVGIANSVAQGVMYAVAAGNETGDAAGSGPANCDSVVTVSAFADYDGLPGGLSSQLCPWNGTFQPDPDDSFAWFSNFGSLIEVAAPGVCVMSTYPDGLYAAMSGTSMATPHVTGALALFKAATGYAGPYDGPSVMTALNDAAWTRPQDSECGFTDDPDGSPEPVLYLGSSCEAAAATPSPSPTPSPTPSPSPTASATASPTASPTSTPTPSPSPTATEEPLDPSDMDCDHAITGNDPLIIVRFAADIETDLGPDCPPIGALVAPGAAALPAGLRGDLDCSGAVDVKDALVILRRLGGLPDPSPTACTS